MVIQSQSETGALPVDAIYMDLRSIIAILRVLVLFIINPDQKVTQITPKKDRILE